MKKFLKIQNITFICGIILVIRLLYSLLINGGSLTLSTALSVVAIVILSTVYLKSKNKNILFILLITILATILYIPFFTGEKYFCIDNDQYTQYEYFYKEWNRLIDKFISDGSYPFYSFNTFLGNNFFASKVYYLTGDLLYPITRMFSTVNEGLSFESYILIVLSSIFIKLYLKEFSIKKETIINITTLLYCLGGLGTSYISPIAWQRFYCFFPLVFYFIERYRKTNKIVGFSLSVFMCLAFNYYMMFPTTIFIGMYYLFTSIYHNENRSITIKKILKLILGYVVGFMMCGILMIPCMLSMLDNSRVGSGLTKQLFYDIRVYAGYIYSLMTKNIFTDNYFSMNDNGHLSQYCNYINSIVVPVMFSYFFVDRKNREDFVLKVFIIILMIMSLNPLISSIMHGFSGASMRWMYLPAFIYLLGFAVFFDKKDIEVNRFKKGLYLYTLIFIIMTILVLILGIMPNLLNESFMSVVAPLIINYVYLIVLSKNGMRYVLASAAVLCVVYNFIDVYKLNRGYEKYQDSLDRNALEFVQDTDEGRFFRIGIDGEKIAPYVKPLNLNQSLNYGYKSTSTYDSTCEGNISEFLTMNEIYNHIIRITNPECLRMLGVKYYYVNNEEELPDGYEYKFITNNYNWKVYRLESYRPIGFTYSNFTNDSNGITNNNSWNDVLLISDELDKEIKDIKNSQSINFNLEEYYDDNNLKGSINLSEKQVLFFSIPFNSGWKVKDNGQPIKTYKVQGGFIGVVLGPGNHYLELNFVPPGFKAGVVCSGLGCISLIILIIIENKKKKSI